MKNSIKVKFSEMDKIASTTLDNYCKKDMLDNYYEDEKNCYIVVSLNKDNIYSEYGKRAIIKEEIFTYIDELYKISNKTKNINILLDFSDDIEDKEKDYIIELLKTKYALDYRETRLKMKRYAYLSLALLLVGALILIAYVLLEHYQVNYVVSEIISIFAWVFIWESCDFFFFSRKENKILAIKYKDLYNANYKKCVD